MSDTDKESTFELNDELYVKAPQSIVTPADPFIGKTIGNCSILEKINEGGTALIYKAHNNPFDLDRVIKILKPSLIDDEDFFQRFRQEAQLTARLDHPNVLRVFDTGEVNGYFYIEMEYITGQTLREYMIANPKIGERDILSMASQIVKALEYAHNVQISTPTGENIHGILHRDIKPENIMITGGKLIKLMDFGAAKPLSITSNTMQGMIVGTFHYMSPEQLSGGKLDIRSDFFSLGIVLYELFTNQKPFTAENLTGLIQKINECKFIRLRKLRPSISPLTEELIDKLLSKNRDHRPISEKRILEDLDVCAQSFTSWGSGKKVKIPFSIKRHFGALSLIVSVFALFLSGVALWRSTFVSNTPPRFMQSATIPLLDKGKSLEREGRWDDAANTYKMVPSMEKGGLANEYLEAQIRMAIIDLRHFKEFEKTRSVLEKLRTKFSDPAIDAFLGEAYFHLGSFDDAQERIEAALSSQAGSVIQLTPEFKREILYYHAYTLDKKSSQEQFNQALLMEAVKAWNYFIDFSGCATKASDDQCLFARKRLADLEKPERK
ncbi:MAG: serine/threonine-protein kinase [Chitinivibrionales bacterium]